MDIVLQLCQNLAGQRFHCGSLPSPGARRPSPHHNREHLSHKTVFRGLPGFSIVHARSYENLTSRTNSSFTLCPLSPDQRHRSKGEKHSVSFCSETISRLPSRESCVPEVMEGHREVNESVRESLEGRTDEGTRSGEVSETTSHSPRSTLVTLLHRHKRSKRCS